jgi:hypothetical protein
MELRTLSGETTPNYRSNKFLPLAGLGCKYKSGQGGYLFTSEMAISFQYVEATCDTASYYNRRCTPFIHPHCRICTYLHPLVVHVYTTIHTPKTPNTPLNAPYTREYAIRPTFTTS